jgi:hypothetical protein
MQCPGCKGDLPRPEPTAESKPKQGSAATPRSSKAGVQTPEEALRADTPPVPCPPCGWSTMWNE